LTADGERAPEARLAAARGMLHWLLRRRWEAADAVVALSVGLVLVILGIFAVLSWQGYQQTLDSARAKSQQAADLVAAQAGWMLGSSLGALELIESKLAFEPAELEPETKAELDAALAALPADASLGLYDPAGAELPNGGTPALPHSIAGTDYFAALANGADWTIAPQAQDATSGAPLIVVARRLGGDIFAGVAVLALDAAVMERFWAPQRLGADSTVGLARDDGRFIARYPPLTAPLDLASASPFWSQIAAAPQGTYESGRSPADGVARVVGFRHLPEFGVVAFGSISQDVMLAGLWNAIWVVLWLLLPIALALLGGSLFAARLLRQSAQTQRKLAGAVAHNEVLFREIHHRVKNNLQSVAGLLQMQPIPREIKANMSQRIAAMSAVHEHIYRSDDFSIVHVRDYLHTLIETIRAGHDPAVEVRAELDDLSVDKDAATPLGLILNEVVTNAFKHAFEDGRAGVLAVRLVVGEDGRGQLTIEDNGVGFDPERPAKGIGRRLIGALTGQIGGEASFASMAGTGSRFTLRFPLAGAGTAP
jgi:two-component sensor histidine kinase